MAATESELAVRNLHRVKLSCPLCDWTDVVIRETREAAMEGGNAKIVDHNQMAGHQLSGTPRSGYYRGEPLN